MVRKGQVSNIYSPKVKIINIHINYIKPRDVIDDGIVALFNALLNRNLRDPIVVSPDTKITLLRYKQEMKALSPIIISILY